MLAVLFDLDGTLLDTLEDLASAANEALSRAGYPPHPVAAYRHFVGNGTDCLMRRALPEGEAQRLGEPACGLIAESMRTIYAQHATEATRPYPGIEALLRTLSARHIPTGIVTNKPHAAALAVVRHYFPEHNFAAVRGAEPSMPLKPDPTVVLHVAATWAIAPARIIYLGDSDVDILTARHAGMLAAGAGWGFRGPDELRACGADCLLENPEALLALLD